MDLRTWPRPAAAVVVIPPQPGDPRGGSPHRGTPTSPAPRHPTGHRAGAPGSGGTHLIGSFPSDSDGSPVGDGTSTAAHWTADIHVGGSPSPDTYSDVWALCLNLDHGHEE
ncbi:hypothetical protein [Streptomyces sp. NPDC057579]|uniref:hypothetical protein n=1 Tax=Streptomyces sp. NPDC057579 TaxID=3346172 RepID=UPI0036CB66CF